MHRLARPVRATFLLLGWALRAATPLPHAEPGLELPIKIFTTADGLPTDRIGRVFSDSRGFLWLGTEDGLSRFDGTRFLNFGTEQGLPYPVVSDILEAQEGFYWIATNNGFASLDATPAAQINNAAGYRIRKFTVSAEAAPNRVNTLFRDHSGKLWLGTDGGVFTLDNEHDVSFHRVELALSVPDLLVQVWQIREDAEGSIWMGTKYGLVRRLPDGRIIQYRIRSNAATDHVLGLMIDPHGILWIGHETSLLVFHPAPLAEVRVDSPITHDDSLELSKLPNGFAIPRRRGEARFLPLGVEVRAIRQLSNGPVWATTSFGGLFEFDGDHYRPVNPNRPAFHDLSAAITEDRDGNVWLGSQSSGLIRLSPEGFVTYGKADGISSQLGGLMEFDDHHMMVLQGPMQVSWFYRESSGGATLLPKIITAPQSGARQWRATQTLLHDHLGDWWLCTPNGLYRYPPARDIDHFLSGRPARIYTAKDGMAETSVLRLYEDSRGDIWVSSFAPGREPLTRWERSTDHFQRYSDRDGLPAFSAANSFNEDRAGNLWISFREGGIARYRDGKFRFFTSADGFPDGPISSCFIDRADRMWCASLEHGLLRMDTRGEHLNPVVYDSHRGLSSDLVLGVGEDSRGRMFLGWTQGLDRLDPSTDQVRHFTSADGLAAGRVFAVVRDRTGSMWFVTRTGISRLVEDDRALASARKSFPSPVYISGVRVAGTKLPVSPFGVSSIALGDLAPEKNSMQIDYLRVNFSSGDAARFEYKLDGADAQWSEPTPLTTVNYAGLRSGSYQFQVRAVGADGAPLGDPAVISLHILPPLWLRWWAIGAVLAILATSFVAFERYRTARIQEIAVALEKSQVLTAALSDSEARFRTLAETASDAIITTNADGVIVFVNSAAERIFGGAASEMTGRHVAALIPYAWQHLRDREAWTGSSWKPIELPGIHPTNRELLLEVSFAEFHQENRSYFTAVARDITERKRADEALRRLREERLAELERVRRRIATDLHDDIGSSLTQISVLSEVVQQRVNEPDFSVSAPLAYIALASSELIDSMSDIVWAINPQRDKLSDLLHRMRRFAADTFTARNIAFKMALPGDEQDVRLEGNLRRELFLIFKESVNNIVRHAGATAAEIELQLGQGKLELSIRDNGAGFDTDASYDGHGLTSMRNRAAEIGAVYELVSVKGGGTSIRVGVPLPA